MLAQWPLSGIKRPLPGSTTQPCFSPRQQDATAVFRTPRIANTIKFPILRHIGTLDHDGGIVTAPAVYAMDLTLMRRRNSSFIHDTGDDASDLAGYLEEYLAVPRRAAVG